MLRVTPNNTPEGRIVSNDQHAASGKLTSSSSKRGYQESISLQESKPSSNKRSKFEAFSKENTRPVTSDVVIKVPSDCSTVEDAVASANAAFLRAASRLESNTTVTILIDPTSSYEIETTLMVKAIGDNAKLVIASAGEESVSSSQQPGWDSDSQVTLVMETREANVPLLQVCHGSLSLRNISLDHCSTMDAWLLVRTKVNNNAAIVVNKPSPSWEKQQETPTSISMNSVILRSHSGKGIINRNPACQISEKDCFVAKSCF